MERARWERNLPETTPLRERLMAPCPSPLQQRSPIGYEKVFQGECLNEPFNAAI
jgi:hypothetical protein